MIQSREQILEELRKVMEQMHQHVGDLQLGVRGKADEAMSSILDTGLVDMRLTVEWAMLRGRLAELTEWSRYLSSRVEEMSK